MDRIIATIKPGDTGTQVANLQDAILALLERKIIHALDATNKPAPEALEKLTEGLKQEREQSLFGKDTLHLMMYFQLEQKFGDDLCGVVEEKTAAKLNELLRSIGALDEATFLIVRGTVSYPDKSP